MPSYYTGRTTYAPTRIGDMDAGYDAWMEEEDLDWEEDEEEEDGEDYAGEDE